jgi:hypothetical protein
MMISPRIFLLAALVSLQLPAATAQNQTLEAWMLGNGVKANSPDTIFNACISGFDADVLEVWYTPMDVWVVANSLPSHSLEPFGSRTEFPPATDNTWRLSRTPPSTEGAGDGLALAAIGITVNGVQLFSWFDATSYNDLDIWNYIAQLSRRPDLDVNGGHPVPGGMTRNANGHDTFAHTHRWTDDINHTHDDDTAEDGSTRSGTYTEGGPYHYHAYPVQLGAQLGDTGAQHSPLLGFAFDGNPIYGPYGYANTNGTGGIIRMEPSYQLRNITNRHSIIDDTGTTQALMPAEFGPNINMMNPLGTFREDFYYAAGSGHLDEHNGRFAVTPEFPSGVYAYHFTIDSMGDSVYPFSVGPDEYYSNAIAENTGMGAGNSMIPPVAIMYTGGASVDNWLSYE